MSKHDRADSSLASATACAAIALLLICPNSSAADNLKTRQKSTEVQTGEDRRGTSDNPLAVKIVGRDDRRGGADTAVLVRIVESEDSRLKAADEKRRWEEKSLIDQRLVTITFWLFVATAVLAVFTALLWLVTYKLSRDARRTAAQQAIDTKSAINLAERSASAAEKNLAEVQRAHLFPTDGFEVTRTLDASKSVVSYLFRAKFTNCGPTPAVKTRTCSAFRVVPRGEPPQSWTNLDSLGCAIVGPSQEISASDIELPIQAMMDCYEGTTEVYLFARANYQDIVIPGKRHHTQIFVQLKIASDPRVLVDPAQTSFKVHAQELNSCD